ncbi:MAG: glutamate--tRNA ligase [Methanomassiliicoccales archaeon]
MSSIEDSIRQFALQNAVLHNGRAEAKNVINKVIGRHPEIRNEMGRWVPLINKIVQEVNSLSPEQQRAELEHCAPELLARKEGPAEPKLRPLEVREGRQVVLRLAPFPSGAPHIGNLRSFILNDEYAKRYNGKLLLIYDDTIGSDEKAVLPESYDLIKDALRWLGIEYHGTYHKSDRMELYYEWGKRLIEKGAAYACSCDAETLRSNRERGVECEHRSRPLEEQLDIWDDMLSGKYAEGSMVIRVKTDMRHKNPAFRDRVLFRISEKQHPRVGKKYRVWPLLEMTWAVDDYLLGITHVIRGKDLMIEDEMEKHIWQLLGLDPDIQFLHFGMLRVEDAKISKSKAYKEVTSGEYIGWEDPRTWSVQSLRARGFRPEAIRRFIVDMGMSLSDISTPAENMYAYNRSIVDPTAPRSTFLKDPVRVEISGLPPGINEVRMPVHPERPEMGMRVLSASESVLLARSDFEALQGKEVRLKDFCNVVLQGVRAIFVSVENKDLPRITWLNANEDKLIDMKVMMVDGEMVKGKGEPNLREMPMGTVVQMERFGFVSLHSRDRDGNLTAFYTHR